MRSGVWGQSPRIEPTDCHQASGTVKRKTKFKGNYTALSASLSGRYRRYKRGILKKSVISRVCGFDSTHCMSTIVLIASEYYVSIEYRALS
jgi:hypothetical protein